MVATERLRPLLRGIYAQAIIVYLAARLIGLAVLVLLADWHDKDALERLTAWDGDWYLAIAEHGYDGVTGFTDAAGNFEQGVTPRAFFPLYPWLVGIVQHLPGLDFTAAALIVTVFAGVALACGLARLAVVLGHDRRVALVLTALVAGAPTAIALSMAYTEALFMALAAWTLVFVLERRWLLAGLSCALAGLTRSTALLLIGAVVIAVVIEVWQLRDRRYWAIVGALIAPLGLLGYWASVSYATGSLMGWFEIQEGWFSGVDGGVSTGEWIVSTLATGKNVMEVVGVGIMLSAIVLVAVMIRQRMPWPLVVYGGGFVLLMIVMNGLHFAKARYLLPAAVVLLIPVAIALVKRERLTMIAGTVTFVLVGSWFSAYTLTGWGLAV